jgi:hypothetical protein
MIRLKRMVSIAGALLLMGVSGCQPPDGDGPPPAKEDGTLTMALSDAAAIEGIDVLGAAFEHGADPMASPMLAVVDFTVSGGGGSGAMRDTDPPYDTWVGTGGGSYDVYLWVDMNGNRATVQYPESGVDMQLADFPLAVVIDGDTTVTLTAADFVTVP